MVDLAKIRKKAKKKESVEPEVVPAPAEAPAAEPRNLETAEPEAATAVAALRTKLEKFKQDAGKRREVETAKIEATTTALLELLTFTIAGESYAVDIERIVEIVTARPVTRIPNADRTVVGIISLRGTVVTLLDVRAKLRHPIAPTATDTTRIVVIDLRGEIVGFTVDRVLRVVKVDANDVEPHPVVHASEQEEAIRGVFRIANALTILLDLDKLLGSRALTATVA